MAGGPKPSPENNGWAIGDRRIYGNQDYQNFMEAESFYDLLEKEIAPMFYDRTADGIPRRWINTMKTSMKTCCPLLTATIAWCESTPRISTCPPTGDGTVSNRTNSKSPATSPTGGIR